MEGPEPGGPLDPCPICASPAPRRPRASPLDPLEIDCARCGAYRVTGLAVLLLEADPSLRLDLGAWLARLEPRSDADRPTLDRSRVRALRGRPALPRSAIL